MTQSENSVLLIFIDGLGIGERSAHNPFYHLSADEASPLAVFQDEKPLLPHDGICAQTDACLGVEGRPQSASGQTTILTGVNAPAALGFHKHGFPNETLRAILREHSIFLQLKRAGVEPNTFANAYTPRFFRARPRWISATTCAVEAAEMQFRTLDDLRAGRALFHDFTNQVLLEPNEHYNLTAEDARGIEPRDAIEAAEILTRIARAHRFTLYEYFITDRIGHAQDMNAARAILKNLARFVREVLARANLENTTVIVTSDHGNLEDLSVHNHTRNFVPTLAFGVQRERVARRVKSLMDIAPTIVELLTAQENRSI
jgi:2,3-bisphosphoglycerate-independent phosphoglycerate mutase